MVQNALQSMWSDAKSCDRLNMIVLGLDLNSV